MGVLDGRTLAKERVGLVRLEPTIILPVQIVCKTGERKLLRQRAQALAQDLGLAVGISSGATAVAAARLGCIAG